MITWILLVAATLVTATISGILGMAGGVTLLGVMTALLPAKDVVPIHGFVQLVSNLTRTAVFLKSVDWKIFSIYVFPMIAGAALAAVLWTGELEWFEPAIGAFILVFLVYRRFSPAVRNLPRWTYAPLGLLTGFLAIFIGATGPLLAPFFLRDELENEQVIATKAVCQAALHLIKIPAFLALGFDFRPYAGLLAAMVVAAALGAFAGRWALGKISKRVFTILFEIVLAAIAIELLISGLRG